MEPRCTVSYKFIKVLSRSDNLMNEMTLPRKFLVEYADRLPPEFKLKLRYGYELPVDYNKTKGTIKGLYVFLGQFRLRGGETLVFEYYGRYDLKLYVIGKDCAEIKYPDILHHFQSGTRLNVSLRSGGCRFVQFINTLEPIIDEIEPPLSFVVNCGGQIRSAFNFVMSNGHKSKGSYNCNNNKITGLEHMCEKLGLEDFNAFHMILFTYDGRSVFEISVFDENLSEIVFPKSGFANVDNNVFDACEETGTECADRRHKFEITIKPFHMLDYSYGVNIPARFKNLWLLWRNSNYLQVRLGKISWPLQIKPRHDWKRVSLNEGWIEFRNDLGLQVGDICLFECEDPSDKFDRFKVKVVRKKN